jgi:hypothetical protein
MKSGIGGSHVDGNRSVSSMDTLQLNQSPKVKQVLSKNNINNRRSMLDKKKGEGVRSGEAEIQTSGNSDRSSKNTSMMNNNN